MERALLRGVHMLTRIHAFALVGLPVTWAVALAGLHATRVAYLLAAAPPRPPTPPTRDDDGPSSGPRRAFVRNPLSSSAPLFGTHRRVEDGGAFFANPYAAPRCGDGIVVTGTAVAETAWASFAILSGGSGAAPGSHVVRQRQRYAGRWVWLVGWDRVWLSTETTLCQVDLFAKPAPPETTAAPAVAAASGTEGVVQRAPGEYVVDRGFVERTLSTPSLFRGTRVVPTGDAAGERGLRVLAVKPGSVVAAVGVESGDVLRSVNGFDLGDPEKALEAYARLRTADRLVLEVVRNGFVVTLRYDIR